MEYLRGKKNYAKFRYPTNIIFSVIIIETGTQQRWEAGHTDLQTDQPAQQPGGTAGWLCCPLDCLRS